MIKGFNKQIDRTEKKAKILAICNCCGNIWKEEIIYTIALANSKTYDFCSKCNGFKPGVPCSHPGCLNHISHPCEGCGRINGGLPLEEK